MARLAGSSPTLSQRLRCAAARCVLPWTRHKLPGWRYAAGLVGAPYDDGWRGLPMVECVDAAHGYRVRIDRADWSERQLWFDGTYYEHATRELIRAGVRAGDTFIDVGAHIGLVTLLAAARVGTGGLVLSFEPNPPVFARLRAHVDMNNLGTVVHARMVALGSTSGELELNIPQGHSTMASFGSPRDLPHWERRRTARVPIDRGDAAVEAQIGARENPLFIKIDVEGFEREVLTGLERTLRRTRPCVLMECDDEMLRHAGSSEAEVWSFMNDLDYEAYEASAEAGRPALALRKLERPQDRHVADIVWIAPRSEHALRLAPHLDAGLRVVTRPGSSLPARGPR